MIKKIYFSKKIFDYFIVGLTTALLCLFCTYMFVQYVKNSKEPKNARLSVVISHDGGAQRIKFWFDKSLGKQYLFLPAYASAENVCLSIPKNVEIMIGENRFSNGDSLHDLDFSGEYHIELYEKGKKVDSGTLEIMQASEIPSLYIETETGSLDAIHKDKEHKEMGKISVLTGNGSVDYSGVLEFIKGRGNNSWEQFNKKTYRFELAQAANLLGMGSEKSWVLVTAAHSLNLKAYIAYEIAQSAKLPYSVDTVFVDLYINDEYRGIYLLAESIKVGAERVNIDDLDAVSQTINNKPLKDYPKMTENSFKYSYIPNDPSDITGGYLMEMEVFNRFQNESAGFATNSGQRVVIHSPSRVTLRQVEYVSDLVQQMEDSIFSDDGINPSTGKNFTEYIDLDSWVKRYLLDEIVTNRDAGRTSSFFYKYSDSKSSLLYAGPAWDYNGMLVNPVSFYANQEDRYMMNYQTPDWFHKMYSQPVFYNAVVSEYENTFLPILKELLDSEIDRHWESIAASDNMNWFRWKDIDIGDHTNQPEVLKAFLDKRVNFLTAAWLKNEIYHTIRIKSDRDITVSYFSAKPGETLLNVLLNVDPELANLEFVIYGEKVKFDINTPITEDIALSQYVEAPPKQKGLRLISRISQPYMLVILLIACIGFLLVVEIKRYFFYHRKKGG